MLSIGLFALLSVAMSVLRWQHVQRVFLTRSIISAPIHTETLSHENKASLLGSSFFFLPSCLSLLASVSPQDETARSYTSMIPSNSKSADCLCSSRRIILEMLYRVAYLKGLV